MAKLLKMLLGLVGVLLLIVLVALLVITNNLGQIIKTGINDFGPDILGVPVSVGSVDVSLMGGSIMVNTLHVANPPGFSDANIFELGEVSIAVDLQSLRRDVIVVNEIIIDGAAVSAEQVGSKINLQVLANKLDSGASSEASSSETSSSEAGGDGTPSEPAELAIAQFFFSNAAVAVSSDSLGDADIDMPSIVLEDIGTAEAGLTVESAAQAILKPVMKQVLDELKKQALNKAVDKEIDKALDKALGDKAGEAKGLLKGLLNR